MAGVLFVLLAASASAVQVVTLDFDTFTTPDEEPEDHVYSPGEREAIFGILNDLFRTDPADPMGGPFGVTFEILDPADPPTPFTTTIVKFNNGAFGSAEGIDFLNRDDADDVNVNALGVLSLFVDSPRSPELGGGVWTVEDLTTPESIIAASAQIAAHEVGHALGLRHHDAFGPIGSGIGVSPSSYTPAYPGPALMNLTSQHLMGLNSAVALSADNLLTPSHFSERSALKLTLAAIENEIGPNPLYAEEADFPMGDAPDFFAFSGDTLIPLFELPVANTLESPHEWAPIHGGPDALPAAAGVVAGEIESRPPESSDTDHFSLVLDEPGRVTIEVISEQNVNTTDVVNPNLALLDVATALPVPYETGDALAMDQFESTDAILFDVDLPAGDYVVEVFPATAGDTGDYELLVYVFPDVEFPLVGDYNEDGVVDAADYTVWRDAEGVAETLPNREPGVEGVVSTIDYDVWVENYGEFEVGLLDGPPEGGLLTGVPEPGAAGLVLLAVGALGARLPRRWSDRGLNPRG